MFTQMFPTNPRGAEYNVPFGSIRPPENQVNITGNNAGNQQDAFEAFTRVIGPQQASVQQTLADNWTQAAAAMGPASGQAWLNNQIAQSGSDPRQARSQADINASLWNMFQQKEDINTLNRYFPQKYQQSFYS